MTLSYLARICFELLLWLPFCCRFYTFYKIEVLTIISHSNVFQIIHRNCKMRVISLLLAIFYNWNRPQQFTVIDTQWTDIIQYPQPFCRESYDARRPLYVENGTCLIRHILLFVFPFLNPNLLLTKVTISYFVQKIKLFWIQN